MSTEYMMECLGCCTFEGVFSLVYGIEELMMSDRKWDNRDLGQICTQWGNLYQLSCWGTSDIFFVNVSE